MRPGQAGRPPQGGVLASSLLSLCRGAGASRRAGFSWRGRSTAPEAAVGLAHRSVAWEGRLGPRLAIARDAGVHQLRLQVLRSRRVVVMCRGRSGTARAMGSTQQTAQEFSALQLKR